MTATHGVGTYGNAAGTVTPLDHKMAQLGDYVKTAANTIRAGLLWDGSTTIVSGKANMSYDVRAFTAVLSRGATLGAVKLANDGVYNVATTAAPGSNSRYDVVYVWQREYSIDGTDSNPVIGVVQGTAAASPTVPSLSAYPGALELARILVPSGVTATNSGTTITQTAPFTAKAGGIIPFRNTTERDAGTYIESQLGWLIDSDSFIAYNGSAWVSPRSALIPTIAGTGGTSAVSSTTGEVTFSGSLTALNVYIPTASLALLTAAKWVEFTIGYKGSTAGTQTIQLVDGTGTVNTATKYYVEFSYGNSAGTATAIPGSVSTSWPGVGAGSRKRRRYSFKAFNLAVAQHTEIEGVLREDDLAGTNRNYGTITGTHEVNTAFSGIRLVLSGVGTITNGQITIEAHY